MTNSYDHPCEKKINLPDVVISQIVHLAQNPYNSNPKPYETSNIVPDDKIQMDKLAQEFLFEITNYYVTYMQHRGAMTPQVGDIYLALEHFAKIYSKKPVLFVQTTNVDGAVSDSDSSVDEESTFDEIDEDDDLEEKESDDIEDSLEGVYCRDSYKYSRKELEIFEAVFPSIMSLNHDKVFDLNDEDFQELLSTPMRFYNCQLDMPESTIRFLKPAFYAFLVKSFRDLTIQNLLSTKDYHQPNTPDESNSRKRSYHEITPNKPFHVLLSRT